MDFPRDYYFASAFSKNLFATEKKSNSGLDSNYTGCVCVYLCVKFAVLFTEYTANYSNERSHDAPCEKFYNLF